MSRSIISRILFLCQASLLASCSSQQSGYDLPVVNVVSVNTDPGSPLAFDITLRVSNPNNFALKLAGVSWTLDLEGYRVMTAVGNELPVIPAYGEGEVVLTGTPSLLNSARVIMDLASSGSDSVDYSFSAKLDPVGIIPPISVRDAGNLSLAGVSRHP